MGWLLAWEERARRESIRDGNFEKYNRFMPLGEMFGVLHGVNVWYWFEPQGLV